MGITSRRMEGAARHMELPPTITSLSNCSHKYEYMFANNSDVAISKRGFTQGCRVGRAGRFHVRAGAYPYGNIAAYVAM